MTIDVCAIANFVVVYKYIMKQKITNLSLLAVFMAVTTTFSMQVSAAPNTTKANTQINVTANGTATTSDCGTSILPCWTIPQLISNIILIMTAGVGILAVGAFVYAGILYTSSAGNPEQTKKAITMIRNTVLGIVAYALMYLILNFIVPGGVKITP